MPIPGALITSSGMPTLSLLSGGRLDSTPFAKSDMDTSSATERQGQGKAALLMWKLESYLGLLA